MSAEPVTDPTQITRIKPGRSLRQSRVGSSHHVHPDALR